MAPAERVHGATQPPLCHCPPSRPPVALPEPFLVPRLWLANKTCHRATVPVSAFHSHSSGTLLRQGCGQLCQPSKRLGPACPCNSPCNGPVNGPVLVIVLVLVLVSVCSQPVGGLNGPTDGSECLSACPCSMAAGFDDQIPSFLIYLIPSPPGTARPPSRTLFVLG